MTPHEFVEKWKRADLSERSACQQHFLDLCDLLGQPKPAAADPDGAWYTFERGVRKVDGGSGWADVWMRGHFGWEYKGKLKNLEAAYKQLLQYREALENPPLLVVCDLHRFEIHTNFTGTLKVVHAFDLDELAQPKNLDILRKVFTDPAALKPGVTAQGVTEQAAELIGQLADGMRIRSIPAPRAAHFLMKLMFCMFAEDIGLLPGNVFSKIMEAATKPGRSGLPESDAGQRFAQLLRGLFEAMARGGLFGTDDIMHFNGGLFADSEVIELTRDEMLKLRDVSRLDWSGLEPSIFGTLFERTLDPEKRSQIGAHYTSREDILTLLEPVVMQPLRREWAEVRAKCEKLTAELATAKTAAAKRKKIQQRERTLLDFVERLAHVSILDPACGSGNFLYVALNLLLDLEKEVITFAARQKLGLLPRVRPTQLAGIEINAYAQELASVVIWIGYLQWMHHNGFNPPHDPVLEPIESIRRMDAILDLSDPEHPREPDWPEAEFIVGNPPFLGGKRLRTELGDSYVKAMFSAFDGEVPRECDLVTYWFEKSRKCLDAGRSKRVGLIATQAIRAGANRRVLERIKASGDIFMAWSDRPWVLDGADVRVSLIAFDDGKEAERTLDGVNVGTIHANLTAAADITKARRLSENRDRCFMGDTKGGAFDITEREALSMVNAANPHGSPNSDVVVPWVNALDITRRSRWMWIIDFDVDRSRDDAALYEVPFEQLRRDVYPVRQTNNRAVYRDRWWIHVEPRRQLRSALGTLDRFIVIPSVAKHRLVVWLSPPVLPDHKLFVVASSEDHNFGILHSRPHELWALATSSRHGVGNDPTYNNTTCFEPFPFPESDEAERAAIAAAAKELDQLRSRWLNPPEWTRTEVLEFPGSAHGPWRRYVDPATVDARGIGTVRYPRLVPKDAECAKHLKKRTLTNLYNQRPTWLDLAHRRLDEAVFAAYGWPANLTDEQLLERLLDLNLTRAAEQTAAPSPSPPAAEF